MAEDTGQDKTEEPTAKRLADARKKGQVARSRELNTFVMLITSSVLLLFMGGYIGQGMIEIMQTQFQLSREVIFAPESPIKFFKQALLDAFWLISPFLAVLVVAALIGPLILSGWVFSWEALTPKLEKLDPVKGLARLFSKKGLIELLKALIKFLLVFGVAMILYKSFLNEFLGLSAEPLGQAVQHALFHIGLGFLVLSASLILIVMVDLPYQLWDHHEKLKMTRQEVRDEMKESQGNPEIKGRQRRIQMEMSQRRMMEEVPKADVIVTNPTHFAVALQYDQNSSAAPKVIAKGTDLIAAQIRNLAAGANVPLLVAPPLARALYYSTDLKQEIPQGLFLAVAQVLAYVYQLKTAKAYGWDAPLPPQDLPIPAEYRRDE
ncbi:MAG: flagellar biosynthesis protein FlhB [Gammaproteobacteria bacterium HGW-Gammaproteobacteria-10]|nr:MAG: flagellar biosynthesis protein FlhB [Gammaproteobacteria bacterium HGW-Gammaproteobacteria-10]